MYTEIGSFDAKAKLSELLREVERGRRYTITLRGRPVADLVGSKRKRHSRGYTLSGRIHAKASQGAWSFHSETFRMDHGRPSIRLVVGPSMAPAWLFERENPEDTDRATGRYRLSTAPKLWCLPSGISGLRMHCWSASAGVS
jgi:prevent-host-death family protein